MNPLEVEIAQCLQKERKGYVFVVKVIHTSQSSSVSVFKFFGTGDGTVEGRAFFDSSLGVITRYQNIRFSKDVGI